MRVSWPQPAPSPSPPPFTLTLTTHPHHSPSPLATRHSPLATRHSPLNLHLHAIPTPDQAELTYDYEHLGEGADALGALAAGSSPFSEVLKEAKRPALLIGQGALQGADGAAVRALTRQIAAANGVVAVEDGWNGFGTLQHTSSAAGALDVGFVPGPTAAPLDALKVVFLLGADDVAAAEGAFVIYQGHHGDAGAQAADLVLPGAAYTEKSGTYVNTEGRVQRTARAVDPPGDAREDWSVLVAISQAPSPQTQAQPRPQP